MFVAFGAAAAALYKPTWALVDLLPCTDSSVIEHCARLPKQSALCSPNPLNGTPALDPFPLWQVSFGCPPLHLSYTRYVGGVTWKQVQGSFVSSYSTSSRRLSAVSRPSDTHYNNNGTNGLHANYVQLLKGVYEVVRHQPHVGRCCASARRRQLHP